MTKQDLLQTINKALANNEAIVLEAGDYFTDYIKLIPNRCLKNFFVEVDKYGVDVPNALDDYDAVKINSVDAFENGCYTGEMNQYFIYGALPSQDVAYRNYKEYIHRLD